MKDFNPAATAHAPNALKAISINVEKLERVKNKRLISICSWSNERMVFEQQMPARHFVRNAASIRNGRNRRGRHLRLTC